MSTQKVCLVTGAAGIIGQRVISSLIAENKKVIALGEPDDVFSPSVLNTNRIRINTLLPVTSKSFQNYDVQFCFGDLSDISFLASIFSSATPNNIEIEYVIHLSANKDIQASSPKAYHPSFGDTVNLLEVARAYWQTDKNVFKGFFYASDENNEVNSKIENMMQNIMDKYGFPIEIYSPKESYKTSSSTASLLYRFVSPFGKKTLPLKETDSSDANKKYIASLIGAITHFVEK
ncbi:MAG: GDP-mannose 4,6-dehydratase [Alphaproteobacteria bacterium]|nr:GDP-mannose 4,6-dehydratase [Alphaproteobacteria bacterium]